MTPETQRSHARLGIASFVIALAAGVIAIIAMVAGIIGITLAQRAHASSFPFAFGLGLVIFLAYCGNLVGLGLGIAAVRRREHNRGLAIVGLCLNACGALLGTLVVIAGFSIRPDR